MLRYTHHYAIFDVSPLHTSTCSCSADCLTTQPQPIYAWCQSPSHAITAMAFVSTPLSQGSAQEFDISHNSLHTDVALGSLYLSYAKRLDLSWNDLYGTIVAADFISGYVRLTTLKSLSAAHTTRQRQPVSDLYPWWCRC